MPTSVESKVLVQHIERIEGSIADAKDASEVVKDNYALAKSDGFDVPALKAVIRRRAIEREKLELHDSMVELYEGALWS